MYPLVFWWSYETLCLKIQFSLPETNSKFTPLNLNCWKMTFPLLRFSLCSGTFAIRFEGVYILKLDMRLPTPSGMQALKTGPTRMLIRLTYLPYESLGERFSGRQGKDVVSYQIRGAIFLKITGVVSIFRLSFRESPTWSWPTSPCSMGGKPEKIHIKKLF